MKVLMVGNMKSLGQHSMLAYEEVLSQGLSDLGHSITQVRPEEPERPGKRAAQWQEHMAFPRQLKQLAPEFDLVHIIDQGQAFHAQSCGGTPVVVTCHDLMRVRAALGQIEWMSVGLLGRRLQKSIQQGLCAADRIICVSEKTCQDCAGHLGISGEKMRVVLNGFFRDLRDQEPKPKELLILHVGGNQPYKNRPGAVQIADALLSRSEFAEWSFVLAGKEPDDELEKALRLAGNRDRMRVEVSPTGEALGDLYLRSSILLFPSLDEGFGLPILEGQSARCMVGTTDRPPMSEAGGDAFVGLDPADAPQANAGRIAAAWPERESFISRGLANLDRFSPEKMAHEVAAVYEEMAG